MQEIEIKEVEIINYTSCISVIVGTVTVVLTSPTLGGRLFFIESNTQILDLPNSMSQSVDSGGSVVISNAGKRER